MRGNEIAEILDKIPAEVAWRRPDSIIKTNENWFQVITPSSKIVPLNGVYRSVLSSEEIDASIEATVREFAEHQTPFRWIVTNSARIKTWVHRFRKISTFSNLYD